MVGCVVYVGEVVDGLVSWCVSLVLVIWLCRNNRLLKMFMSVFLFEWIV